MIIFTVDDTGSPDFSTVQAALNFIETIGGGRDDNYLIRIISKNNWGEDVVFPTPIADNGFWIIVEGQLAQDYSTATVGKNKILPLAGTVTTSSSAFKIGATTKVHIKAFQFATFSGVVNPDHISDIDSSGVENIITSNCIFSGGNAATQGFVATGNDLMIFGCSFKDTTGSPAIIMLSNTSVNPTIDRGFNKVLHCFIETLTGNASRCIQYLGASANRGRTQGNRIENNILVQKRQAFSAIVISGSLSNWQTPWVDANWSIQNNVCIYVGNVNFLDGQTLDTNSFYIQWPSPSDANFKFPSDFNSAFPIFDNDSETTIYSTTQFKEFQRIQAFDFHDDMIGTDLSSEKITVAGDVIFDPAIDAKGNIRTRWTPGPIELILGSESVPPVWDTATGIQTLQVTNANSLKATWNNATDVGSPPVTYNIYIRPLASPDVFGTDSIYYFGTTDNLEATIDRDPNDIDAENPIGRALKAGIEYFVIVKATDKKGNEDVNIVFKSETTRIESFPVKNMQNIIRTRFRNQIELVFSNLSGRVQYDNAPLIIKPNAIHVRLAIRPVGSNQVAFGAVKRTRNTGSMVASIFNPTGKGGKEMNDLADLIHAEFGKITVEGIVFKAPTNILVGREGKEWQLDVSVPYHGDSLK